MIKTRVQQVAHPTLADHGRSDHPNPHQHTYTPNPTGGTYQRGKTEPLGD